MIRFLHVYQVANVCMSIYFYVDRYFALVHFKLKFNLELGYDKHVCAGLMLAIWSVFQLQFSGKELASN